MCHCVGSERLGGARLAVVSCVMCMLTGCTQKCSNKNGSFSDARIGPSISKRLEKVFFGKNAGSKDI